MSTTPAVALGDLLGRHEDEVLADWLDAQASASSRRPDLIGKDELRRESAEFLGLLRAALSEDPAGAGPAWRRLHDFLGGLSRSRAIAGFSPSETATFVLSLKEPVFTRLADEFRDDAAAVSAAVWEATAILDRLGLATLEEYQRSREAIIERQHNELLELSTPVVKLWEGVVAVPMIGTLDSERTQVVMETLLERIVETNSFMAIIDITGVPTVDTLVAQHLLKTVAAARLMGADCIISGIRPQIAQTIVHLGLTLSDVTTKATMADAIALALERGGLRIVAAERDI